MPYTQWSLPENEEKLKKAVAESKSIAGVLRELSLAPVGGNYRTIKHHITRLNLDTSHHTGQGWNRENYKNPAGTSTKNSWKRFLIREHGHQCMKCGNKEWNGLPIPLELEHIDGNSTNNDLNNLKILCPNCHAQTSTYRRRKSVLAPVAQR